MKAKTTTLKGVECVLFDEFEVLRYLDAQKVGHSIKWRSCIFCPCYRGSKCPGLVGRTDPNDCDSDVWVNIVDATAMRMAGFSPVEE